MFNGRQDGWWVWQSEGLIMLGQHPDQVHRMTWSLLHVVAQEIAELPFTPGHEMVGKVVLQLASITMNCMLYIWLVIKGGLIKFKVWWNPPFKMVGEVLYASIACSISPQIIACGPEAPVQYAVGARVCVENHFYCGHCYQCTHGTASLMHDC